MTVVQSKNLAAVEIEVGREVVADVAGGSTEVVVGVVALVAGAIEVVAEIAAEVVAEVVGQQR